MHVIHFDSFHSLFWPSHLYYPSPTPPPSFKPLLHILVFLFCDPLSFTRVICVTMGLEIPVRALWYISGYKNEANSSFSLDYISSQQGGVGSYDSLPRFTTYCWWSPVLCKPTTGSLKCHEIMCTELCSAQKIAFPRPPYLLSSFYIFLAPSSVMFPKP